MKDCKEYIPASPGWAVCIPEIDAQGRAKDFCLEGILAWEINYDDGGDYPVVYPVTISGVERGDVLVKDPAGLFIAPLESYDTIEKALDAVNTEGGRNHG